MTKLTLWLLNPALVLATFGTRLTWDALGESLPIMLWSVVHMAGNTALGLFVARLVRVPESFRRPFVMAMVRRPRGPTGRPSTTAVSSRS